MQDSALRQTCDDGGAEGELKLSLMLEKPVKSRSLCLQALG